MKYIIKVLFLVAVLQGYSQGWQVMIEQNRDLPYAEIVAKVDAYFQNQGDVKHSGAKQYGRWKQATQNSLD